MNDLKIYLNGQPADISEQVRPTVSRIVSEYRNPTKKTGSYTYNFKLPLTQRNKRLMGYQHDRQVLGKFRQTYACTVSLNSVDILQGEFVLTSISRAGFEGFVSGSGEGRIADLLGEKTLRDLSTYEEIDFLGDRYVWDRLDADLDGGNAEICFPFVFDSFARLRYLNGGTVDGMYYEQGYESFGISHFVRPILEKTLAEAGYTVSGNVLEEESFKRLVLLYSNREAEPAAYNYGRLNPLAATLTNRYFNQAPVHEGEDYALYAIEPGLWAIDLTDREGDYSFSLGRDGVYTCKYTTEYTFDIQVTSYAMDTVTDTRLESKQYLLFREIGEHEYTEGQNGTLPDDYASVSYYNLTDWSTVNDTGYGDETTSTVTDHLWTHRTTFTSRLVEGKQYRVQVMTAVPHVKQADNTYAQPAKLMLVASHEASHLHITEVKGRQLLDPALFLPKMSQVDFVQAIFKLFSLFYLVDEPTKHITLFTRDEWYAQHAGNITDLSERLSLDHFEESPFTEAEVAETFYRWATDENDHILAFTDYMDEVNGQVPDNAYELPFAPLAFIRQPVKRYENGLPIAEGYELLPCAIPATEAVDMSVTEDYTASSNFAYLPKLALYHKGEHLQPAMYTSVFADAHGYNKLLVQFQRTPGLEGGSYSDEYGLYRYKQLPRLSFFHVSGQPAYALEFDQTRREFRLNKVVGDNIYSNQDPHFVTDTASLEALDRASLALDGDSSLFQRLYRNDLAVLDHSNFTEGQVRMSASLYQQLTGRNIIRIDSDLYLLAEVRNYSLTQGVATLKLYRMVNAAE